MKKHLLDLFMVAIVSMVLLLCLEWGIRLFYPKINTQGLSEALIEWNAYGSTHGLKSNAEGFAFGVPFRVDENGFRKQKHQPSHPKKRIWYLGDSVWMGVGVEDDSVFTALLQADDTEQLHQNGALIGYAMEDYLVWLEERIKATDLPPDEVRIGITLNDIYKHAPKPSGGGWKATQFLKNHSKAYILFKGWISDRSKAYYQYDAAFYQETSPEWENMKSQWLAIQRWSETHQIPVFFIAMPYEYALRTNQVPDVPHQIMASFCTKMKIPFVSLAECMQWHCKPPQKCFLYADGIHFSAFGHRCLANCISNVDFF